MDFLPISINIVNKKILLVGGGKIALEKINSLKRFTSLITVVTDKIKPEVNHEAVQNGYQVVLKEYEKQDIRGHFLVYACTNNTVKNIEIKEDCKAAGILVNVVDNPSLCDFVSPAIYKNGNMTASVGSDGKNVKKSIEWRNKIREYFNGTASI